MPPNIHKCDVKIPQLTVDLSALVGHIEPSCWEGIVMFIKVEIIFLTLSFLMQSKKIFPL